MFGNEPKIRVLYRMSARCGRVPPSNFNNRSCFLNCRAAFPTSDFYALLDSADESCENIMKETGTSYEMTDIGNPAAYHRLLDIITEKCSGGEWKLNDIVYFVENDYCHRAGAEDALLDGMHISDYVTLYDHPDKYNGGEFCCGVHYSDIRAKLHIGRTGYWRTTTSTCMTYGTTVNVLLDDMEIHRRFAEPVPGNKGSGMHDCPLFHNLVLARQRSLISPMPGFATHGDMFGPYIDWKRTLDETQIDVRELQTNA